MSSAEVQQVKISSSHSRLFPGEAMEQGLRDCCRSIRIGKILVHTDEETHDAKVVYAKLPPDIASRKVLLMYPIMSEFNLFMSFFCFYLQGWKGEKTVLAPIEKTYSNDIFSYLSTKTYVVVFMSEVLLMGTNNVCRMCLQRKQYCVATPSEVVVRCSKGVVYLTSPGCPTDIGLQLGKACYPCSR